MRGAASNLCFVVLFAFLTVCAPARAASGCKVQEITELPVTMIGLRPTVAVILNGKAVRLLVDSGSFSTTLSPDAAKALGLNTAYRPEITARGVAGGDVDVRSILVDSVILGRASFPRVHLLVQTGVQEPQIDGLLGENVLGLGDVEYDLAHGVVRLFRAQNCGANDDLGYWSPGKTDFIDLMRNASLDPLPQPSERLGTRLRVRSRTSSSRDVVGQVFVNNRPINAVFDTGASRSMLSLKAAAEAGVTAQTTGVVRTGQISGVEQRPIDAWTAPFASFALGAEEIRGARLMIGAIKLDDAGMLLGADFFLSHRVYVANSQNRLYFTYNGGPVFQLEPPAKGAQDQGLPAPPGSAEPP